jgi:excisionase family DNA binding protein
MQTISTTPDSAVERYLNAREIAMILGVPHRWVVDKARDGLLPSYKLPGSNRLRFIESEVREAMENRRIEDRLEA